jgi:gluconokinase
MSKGIPLTDEDRMPWLDRIGEVMKASLAKGESIIVSCSALKRIYRDRLRSAAGGNLFFVYLEGSKELLTDRMGHRTGHFMPVSLLESQLATLEVPTGEPGVVTVDIDDTVEDIAANAVKGLAAIGVA